jgi:Domain of unknown function (DUF5916)
MLIRRNILPFVMMSIFALSAPAPASAQGAEVKAVRVQKAPKIDGFLSDPEWQSAPPFTGFRQFEPEANAEPTERTELRVLYDESNLYIGVMCFDREPRRIAANTMAHDSAGGSQGGMYGYHHGGQSSSDDLIRVLIDPFQDKRTAYVFYVNPLGARSEGLVYGGEPSLNWDGIWEAKARILDNGWSAELRIPFKTISFKPGLTVWGINVERVIPRKLETDRTSGTNRDSNFNNPMEAAALSGITGIRQGKGLTFRPYGLASSASTPVGTDVSAGRDNSLDGGFDIYKNFTPNLVGVVSYNMDFAETEVDERQINLTRFPLFFPEKRMFFLEGSENFSFSSSISFIPFFSRRIGLFAGEQVPVRFGAKLYGKVGNTNISALDVQTGDYPGLPGTNMFAARMTQNIFAESKVGWIFTNGSPTGEKNTLAGVDFNYTTSRFMGNKNLMLAAWSAYNWNNKPGQHEGFGLRANYPNDLWNVETTYAYYGEALDPGIGFMLRPSIQTFYLRLAYQPRPSRGWLDAVVRQFFFQTSFDYYWDLSGNLETRRVSLSPLSFQTESGERLEIQVEPTRDVLPYDFEVAPGVVIPKGAYDFTQCQISLNTASYRPVILEAAYTFGQFYSGHLDQTTLGATAKLDGHVSLSVRADMVRGRLPEGNFNENVYEFKADFFLTPDLGFMNYIQYDDISRKLGWNARLRWQISPGNDLYLVYNKNWERRFDPMARFYSLEDRGVIKITLSIRP